MILNGQAALIFKIIRTSNEFYKASFISTACAQGIYDQFVNGRVGFDELSEKMGITANKEGLSAWLDLGVRLGELKRVGSDLI